jgi:hypothetical protein
MLGVGETLTDEQWHLPSGAEGWSVKDVVAHAGCLMAFLVAAVGGAAEPDMGIEELNEVQVAEKRGLDGAETMAFVRGELATALETFAPLQEEPLASATGRANDGFLGRGQVEGHVWGAGCREAFHGRAGDDCEPLAPGGISHHRLFLSSGVTGHTGLYSWSPRRLHFFRPRGGRRLRSSHSDCTCAQRPGHFLGLTSGAVPAWAIRSWSWCRPDMPSLG